MKKININIKKPSFSKPWGKKTPAAEDESEHDITPPVAEASRASQVMEDEVLDFTDAAASSSHVEIPEPVVVVPPEPSYQPPEPTKPSKPQRRLNIRPPRPSSERLSQRKSEFMDLMKIVPEPTIQEVVEKEIVDEHAAMKQFIGNLQKYRTANMYNTAPGFDYINWKPYGTYRSHNNHREFHQQAQALSDYVYAVVESGCKGAEEKKWVTLTTSPEQHNALMEASRAASRNASREQLSS